MKLAFEIVKYRAGPGGMLYTVQFADRNVTELDHFLGSEECQLEPAYEGLVSRLLSMVTTRVGFRRAWFEFKGYPTPLCYLAYPDTKLRLYCMYYGDFIVAGSGGVKRTRRLQDTPSTNEAYGRITDVAARMDERRKEDEDFKILGTGIQGLLSFDSE